MKRKHLRSQTMGAYDTLAETLLAIGGVLYGLEAVVNGPSYIGSELSV
ncbi:MAG TPA: hypothetical protein VKJ47_03500 [Candidatus Binatia bacterium]|nr:hypothetical protein [Candidatus Binatia bacterium]